MSPEDIRSNPYNRRLYFNDEKLDLLKTSLQEVGVLVPLIVYPDSQESHKYLLLDGERRWRCALDLGLDSVPVNVTPQPTRLENLLRMFNIHSVREDWPLISVALSLRTVMELAGEDRESRLAEMTGLTRSAVRRGKRLLSLPAGELELIQKEAHPDRAQQVHREDLYLEIEAAASVMRSSVPEIAEQFSRAEIIREFARKREEGTLRAVTDLRDVGKLVKALEAGIVSRELAVGALTRLVTDVDASPSVVFNEVAGQAFEQHSLARRIELLAISLRDVVAQSGASDELRQTLQTLREQINWLLGS